MKSECQTHIETRWGDNGVTLSFTDYPRGDEWNAELPVTYSISLDWNDLTQFEKIIRELNNPFRRWIHAKICLPLKAWIGQ